MDFTSRIDRLSSMEAAQDVFGAAHHRWDLEPPWPEELVAEFEVRHGGRLPEEYRSWVRHVAAAGAGPGNGLFVPGTFDTGRGPKPWERHFGPLGEPFPYSEPVQAHRGRLPGAMPIADLGCGLLALLVTAGPEAGQIWLDDRVSGGGMKPEEGLAFQGWMEVWLEAAEGLATAPWKPPPSHPNEPDHVESAAGVVDAEELSLWSADVQGRIARDDEVQVGKLGVFRRRGPAVRFDQSTALRTAIDGGPMPKGGVASELFVAVLARPAWHALEVPHLLCAWVAEKKPVEGLDYLGRPMQVGRGRRFLVVRSLLP